METKSSAGGDFSGRANWFPPRHFCSPLDSFIPSATLPQSTLLKSSGYFALFHESKQFPALNPAPVNALGFLSKFRRSLEISGLMVQHEGFRQDSGSNSYKGGFWGLLKLEKPPMAIKFGLMTCLIGLLVASSGYILGGLVPAYLLANPTPANITAAAYFGVAFMIISYVGICLLILGVILTVMGCFHKLTAIGLTVTLEGLADVFYVDIGLLILDYTRTIKEKQRQRAAKMLSQNSEVLEQWTSIKNVFEKDSLDHQAKMQKNGR